jgi:iron complex outermembrane receptor protein
LFGTVEALYRDAIFLTERDFSASADTFVPRRAALQHARRALRRPLGPRLLADLPHRHRHGQQLLSSGQRHAQSHLRRPDARRQPRILSRSQPVRHGLAAYARGNTFFSGEFDLSDRLTAFGDVAYYKSDSTMRRQPLALNAPTSDQLKVMAIDNPYNPYGSRFYHPSGTPNADGSARLTGTPRTVSFTAMTLAGLAAETVTTKADVVRARRPA